MRLDSLAYEAGARVAALEAGILYRLASALCSAEPAVKALARAVAVVDVSAGLAELAVEAGLSRPEVSGGEGEGEGGGGGAELCLLGARHLGVEDALWRAAESSCASAAAEAAAGAAGEGEGEGEAGAGAEAEAEVGQESEGGAGAEALAGLANDDDDAAAAAAAAADAAAAAAAATAAASFRGRAPRQSSFVPNDIILGASAGWLARARAASPAPHASLAAALTPRLASARCALVLGPNMGGKSTYLRAAAQAVILAHVGSFIPARPGARIGLTDAVYARVGASDDLSRHTSTFMSEMLEVGEILATASARSLVLVDEVGRGTAVLDGLAIALAVLEDLLHVGRARTLYASHFSELAVTALQAGGGGGGGSGGGGGGSAICAMRMGWEGDGSASASAGAGSSSSVAVTHRVGLHPIHALLGEGGGGGGGGGGAAAAAAEARLAAAVQAALAASQSHGLQVARHAELPARVVARAERVLASLQGSGIPQALAKAVREAARSPQGEA